MQITLEKENKDLKMILSGRLDSATAGEFEQSIAENFTADIEKLVVDLTAVDFISSKGLRVIVATYKELNGRQMELCGANASVIEVFRLSGLLKVINIK